MANFTVFIFMLMACFLGAVLSSSLKFNKGVSEFQIQDEEKELFDFLMGNERRGHATRVGKYIYKNCGDPKKELLVLDGLVLGPDPLSFPGDLKVSFNGSIKSTIDAPLKANVVLQKRVGASWIKIPCLGNIGSCNYDDLCELLSGAVCPPPFVSNNIPCKCPFPAGTYKLPTTTFEVLAAVFPPGDYHASANLTYNGSPVSCVDLMATFD